MLDKKILISIIAIAIVIVQIVQGYSNLPSMSANVQECAVVHSPGNDRFHLVDIQCDRTLMYRYLDSATPSWSSPGYNNNKNNIINNINNNINNNNINSNSNNNRNTFKYSLMKI